MLAQTTPRLSSGIARATLLSLSARLRFAQWTHVAVAKHEHENGGIAVGARKVLAFVTSFSPNPSLHVNSVTLRSGWAGR